MAARLVLSARARTAALVVFLAAPLLVLASCWLVSSLDDFPSKTTTGTDATDGADSAPPSDTSPTDSGSVDAAADTICDASFETDEHNCGSCGHDCVGGVCAAGKCQAVLLSDRENLPTAIGYDSTNIYWLQYQVMDAGPDDSGAVRAIRKADPPGSAYSLVAGQAHPNDLVVDDGGLFWTNETPWKDGGVFHAEKDGGSVTQLAGNIWSPNRVVVDDNYVYWTAADGVGRRANAKPNTVCALAKTPSVAGGPAVDPATHELFWLTEGSLGDGGETGISGGVFRIPSDVLCSSAPGASVEIVTRPAGVPFFLRLDETNVFWTELNNPSGEAINSVSRDGGLPHNVVNDTTSRYEMKLFGDRIYYAGGSVVRSILKSGGAASIVDYPYPSTFVGAKHPRSIAVEDCCVYWSDVGSGVGRADGKVFKIAR